MSALDSHIPPEPMLIFVNNAYTFTVENHIDIVMNIFEVHF